MGKSGRRILPEVNREEWSLLFLLSAASFFNQYDMQLFSLILKQVQEEFLIPEHLLGSLGSLILLGTLPAFAVVVIAERLGRCRVLLWTILGYTVFSTATAFAPNYQVLVVLQFLAKIFTAAEFTLAFVFVVEEFRPQNRAFGVAVLGSLAVLGRGVAMVLFGFIESIPYGWRGLYLVAPIPLLMIAWFRRRLRETHRFERLEAERPSARSFSDWLAPIVALVRLYPQRFIAVSSVLFLIGFSQAPVDYFLPKFMQEFHGWSPARFATVAVLGGALALTGQLVAGWFSDRFGRKPSTVIGLVLEPIAALALYTVLGDSVIPVVVVWLCLSVANDVFRRTYDSELFPPSYRSTASGALGIVITLGASLGLAAEGLLFSWFDSHWTPVRLFVLLGFVTPVIVFFAYPETSGRTLEEISPEAPQDASDS